MSFRVKLPGGFSDNPTPQYTPVVPANISNLRNLSTGLQQNRNYNTLGANTLGANTLGASTLNTFNTFPNKKREELINYDDVKTHMNSVNSNSVNPVNPMNSVNSVNPNANMGPPGPMGLPGLMGPPGPMGPKGSVGPRVVLYNTTTNIDNNDTTVVLLPYHGNKHKLKNMTVYGRVSSLGTLCLLNLNNNSVICEYELPVGDNTVLECLNFTNLPQELCMLKLTCKTNDSSFVNPNDGSHCIFAVEFEMDN